MITPDGANVGPAILILGAPGAGKGTQAKRIAKALQIPAISTGAIFRQNMKDRTELGQKAQSYMDAGEFVPDSVTNPMVEARLSAPDVAGGYLLDGYPRTIEQAFYLRDVLAATGRDLDLVLEIAVELDEVVERLLKRAEIEGRADDTEPVIRRRLEVYKDQTEPMVTYYADQDKLVQVDGVGTVDEVWERIRKVLIEHGLLEK
ncbi:MULTISPECIES: adenylate kinase [unclassified Actinomyces]|uniref:adenylate kinase n=1 Tax=unclassified Actinomyces TaxID=2609248 RepID=UPI0008A5BF05|nr:MULTISPECIES: adenylate kinase [unclassified Actinomyces]MBS5825720.1 adenylate kinase [Actinomyces sp.]OFJ63088.1 adenylate kinase [Actinomyces sp. HMSC075B09]